MMFIISKITAFLRDNLGSKNYDDIVTEFSNPPNDKHALLR